MKIDKTRPSVNYAKDWLPLIFPVWRGVSIMDVITVGQSIAIFSMVTIQQLGDPSANLLVTSQKAVFCNNTHVQWETWF